MGTTVTSKLFTSTPALLVTAVAVVGCGLAVLCFGSRLLFVQLPVVRLSIPKPSAAPTGVKNTLFCLLWVVAGNTRDAREIVHEERKRVRAEREAFERFHERIVDLPTVETAPLAGPPSAFSGVSTDGPDQLQRVRKAYRETVMSTPHYDEEYDDTVVESMAAEFGSTIAAQLQADGPLTPVLKGQLLQAATQSRQRRERFLPSLEREAETLTRMEGTTTEIGSRLDCVSTRLPSELSFRELVATDTRLRDDERRCEELLSERQRQRTDGHTALAVPEASVPDLQTYLYQPLSVTYPVLADVTELVERIQRTRRRITEDVIARF